MWPSPASSKGMASLNSQGFRLGFQYALITSVAVIARAGRADGCVQDMSAFDRDFSRSMQHYRCEVECTKVIDLRFPTMPWLLPRNSSSLQANESRLD